MHPTPSKGRRCESNDASDIETCGDSSIEMMMQRHDVEGIKSGQLSNTLDFGQLEGVSAQRDQAQKSPNQQNICHHGSHDLHEWLFQIPSMELRMLLCSVVLHDFWPRPLLHLVEGCRQRPIAQLQMDSSVSTRNLILL